VDGGLVCAAFHFHDEMVRGVKSRRVQADEIWSFVGRAFGIDVDYATITKVFAKVGTDPASSVRYSPA
jgi:hypothetical protein